MSRFGHRARACYSSTPSLGGAAHAVGVFSMKGPQRNPALRKKCLECL